MSSDHQKHRDKIKKLLELSLSDNEHEAQTALRHALSLMNKHNITEEEVKGQKMTEKVIQAPYYRLPPWYVDLNIFMGNLSGCLVVYRHGRSFSETPGYIRIVGRERDVENSTYLITFLQRELDKSALAYKKKLKQEGQTRVAQWVKSYRCGYIHNIYERMIEARQQFFSNESASNQLVCIDAESREHEARKYFKEVLGRGIIEAKTQASYINEAVYDGFDDASDLKINSAINGQDDTLRLA